MSVARTISALSLFLALTCAPFACSLVVSSELDGKDPNSSGAADAEDVQETSHPEDAGEEGGEDATDATDEDAVAGGDAGPDGNSEAGQVGSKRTTAGLVVLYEFLEGEGTVVTDTSNVSEPLNLSILSGGPTWLSGGGLRLDKAAMIVSDGPATKVIDACVASNAVTVEVWLKLSNLDQTGPARLVSVGADVSGQNLMLGQANTTLKARLLTTLSLVEIVSTVGSLDTNLTHVVYTRNSAGQARFIIDGVTLGNGAVGGEMTSWDSSYRLAIGNEVGGFRPWLGTLYLVAIYARALTKAELEGNFAAGVPKKGSR